MKQTSLIIVLLFSIFLLAECKRETGLINENVKDILVEFVSDYDFAGYMRFDDDVVDTIKTCLSATLYSIDTNHYMTVILSRSPGDAFAGTSYRMQNDYPTMCFSVGDKDLFVYNHSQDNILPFAPEYSYSENEIREKEKEYSVDDIDDRFVIQTYKYRLDGSNVWIEKDSTFDFFQWLYNSN